MGFRWLRAVTSYKEACRKVVLSACLLLSGFAAGMVTALQLYPRDPDIPEPPRKARVHAATFAPLPPLDRKRGAGRMRDLPTVDVLDLEHVRSLAGQRARLRGKIYRVGHSSKSNTYFLDFGPLRSSFTAVIFASAVDAFERENIEVRNYAGKEVEIVGVIEDDPRYGLEMIVEDPKQIREIN